MTIATAAAARHRPRRLAAPTRSRSSRSPARSAPSCRNVTSAPPRATPASWPRSARLLLKHRVLFFRDQDITRAEHVAFARHFGELEDHPVAGSDPEHPGPGAHLQVARRSRTTATRTPGTPTPPGARSRRSAACCAASSARRSAATRCGPTWSLAYERLPEHVKTQIAGLRARHSIEASFGAAMPIEKRLALQAQFPDAEHPVVRTHPETGEKVLFVNAFTTHFTNFHTPANVRFGQDYTPGAQRSCCST